MKTWRCLGNGERLGTCGMGADHKMKLTREIGTRFIYSTSIFLVSTACRVRLLVPVNGAGSHPVGKTEAEGTFNKESDIIRLI